MAIKTAIRFAGKHPFFWVALFIGVLLLGFYGFAGLMIYRYGTLSKDFGWEYNSRGDRWYVSDVDPNGVAANKLEPGDRIIAIDGDEWITRIGDDLNLHLKTEALPAQTAYTIRVERGGTQQDYELSVPLRRGFGNFSRIVPMLVVSILFWILAMLLGVLKPDQRLAQIAFIAAAASSLQVLGGSLLSIDLLRRRTEILKKQCATAVFVRTSTTGLTLCSSRCPLSGNGSKTSRSWRGTSSASSAGYASVRSQEFPKTHADV